MNIFKFITRQFKPLKVEGDVLGWGLAISFLYIFSFSVWTLGIGTDHDNRFAIFFFLVLFFAPIVSFLISLTDFLVEVTTEFVTRDRNTIKKYFTNKMIPEDMKYCNMGLKLYPIPKVAFMICYGTFTLILGLLFVFPIASLAIVIIGSILYYSRKKYDQYWYSQLKKESQND